MQKKVRIFITWTIVSCLAVLSLITTSCFLDNSSYETEVIQGIGDEIGPGDTRSSSTWYKPTGFTVNLFLSKNPEPDYDAFYRYIRFKNASGNTKDVKLYFQRNPNNSLLFTGQVTSAGKDVLASMTEFGNRSYWDKMYLLNINGYAKLTINKCTVIIVYGDNQLWDWEDTLVTNPERTSTQFKQMTMATAYNLVLPGNSGTATIYLPGWTTEYTGRMEYLNFLMNTSYPFSSLTPVVRAMIKDIGKSGSDSYKYGTDPIGLMCSETISYYYEAENITYGNYNFVGITGVWEMVDVFRYNNRLYAYHLGLQRFQKVDTNLNWVLPFNSNTYTPQPGDYLGRIEYGNEHSMMVLKWDENTDEVWVLEGCHPISVRRDYIYIRELNGQDFVVGRVY